MANEKRLIDAEEMYDKAFSLHHCGKMDDESLNDIINLIDEANTVDAVEVVHGHWKEYSHSALVRWKDGEPVWADRSVFRCSRCDFGTIARHNYCPRCGAKMDGGADNEAD